MGIRRQSIIDPKIRELAEQDSYEVK